jgi:hypothetical protein
LYKILIILIVVKKKKRKKNMENNGVNNHRPEAGSQEFIDSWLPVKIQDTAIEVINTRLMNERFARCRDENDISSFQASYQISKNYEVRGSLLAEIVERVVPVTDSRRRNAMLRRVADIRRENNVLIRILEDNVEGVRGREYEARPSLVGSLNITRFKTLDILGALIDCRQRFP